MDTLTVKIPEDLETQLRNKAKTGKEPVSVILRRALAREMQAGTVDFAKLASPYRGMLGLVRVGAIQLLQPWPGHLERTQELMMKYERMDAADASLVVASEIHRSAKIITTDRCDFSIYRR